jgi:hypothetical protein
MQPYVLATVLAAETVVSVAWLWRAFTMRIVEYADSALPLLVSFGVGRNCP